MGLKQNLKQKILAGAMAAGLGALVACGVDKQADEPKPTAGIYTPIGMDSGYKDRTIIKVEKRTKNLEEYFNLETNLKDIWDVYFVDIGFDGVLDKVNFTARSDTRDTREEHKIKRGDKEFPIWEKLYLDIRDAQKIKVYARQDLRDIAAWSDDKIGKFGTGKFGVRFSVRYPVQYPYEGTVTLYDEGANGTLDAVCISGKNSGSPTLPAACENKLFGGVGKLITDPQELAKKQELYQWARKYLGQSLK